MKQKFIGKLVTSLNSLDHSRLISLVYSLRIPSVQHNQFYKFRRGDTDNINFPSNQRNGSQAYHRVKATYTMHNRTEIKKINSVSVSTTPVNLFPDQITDNFANIGTMIRTATITDTVTEVTERRSRDKELKLNKSCINKIIYFLTL